MILVILLRAIVAPLYLIATVIFSLFATLGVTAFVFTQIFGDAGFDTSLPTYVFIFLVALGVDYNIFLMSRVREEARDVPTREAVVRALAATGPVITSAGIILAGTFAVLASLPVTFLLHLGLRGRLRRPARHLHRPHDHGPGDRRAGRRRELVAVGPQVEGPGRAPASPSRRRNTTNISRGMWRGTTGIVAVALGAMLLVAPGAEARLYDDPCPRGSDPSSASRPDGTILVCDKIVGIDGQETRLLNKPPRVCPSGYKLAGTDASYKVALTAHWDYVTQDAWVSWTGGGTSWRTAAGT